MKQSLIIFFVMAIMLSLALDTPARADVTQHGISEPADDHGDSYGNATSVSANSSTSGDIEIENDIDYFNFSATSGHTYTIETTLGTLDDSDITLYDTNGLSVIDSDDDSGSGAASKLVWTCTDTGTYYIMVEGHFYASIGTYTLNISAESGGSAGDDHGDSYSDASALTVGVKKNGNIETGGDEDYFEFDASANVTYDIETTLKTLDDSALTLYKTNGFSKIDTDDNSGAGQASKITWTCTSSGTYYIKVEGDWSSSTGTYSLLVSIATDSGNGGNDDDHADNVSGATYVTIGSTVGGELETSGDLDYFKFSATSGADYTIEITLKSLYDSYIYLYDTNGATTIASDDNSATGLASRIKWTCTTSGTYYIKVEGAIASYTGAYSMKITGSGGDSDDTGGGTDGGSGGDESDGDYGDSAADSSPVGINTPISGGFTDATDVDFFNFSAVAGTDYSITTTVGALSNTVIYLYDTNGITEISNDDNSGSDGGSKISWSCATTGTYYLKLIGTGSYSLLVSASGGSDDGDATDDHGDVASNATNILTGTTVSGTIGDSNDTDWFAFTAELGVNYNIIVSHLTLDGSTIDLYSSDGVTFIASTYSTVNSPSSQIIWAATDDGTYYLKVSGLQGATGTYTITIKNTNADDIVNNSCFIATASYGKMHLPSLFDKIVEVVKGVLY